MDSRFRGNDMLCEGVLSSACNATQPTWKESAWRSGCQEGTVDNWLVSLFPAPNVCKHSLAVPGVGSRSWNLGWVTYVPSNIPGECHDVGVRFASQYQEYRKQTRMFGPVWVWASLAGVLLGVAMVPSISGHK
jgi:hypothetical protein